MIKYEIMFIVRPDLEAAEIKNQLAAVKKVLADEKAKLVDEKDMGQKELAYEVKKFNTGYYFLLVAEAETKAINELEHTIKINENIIRHLIVKVEE